MTKNLSSSSESEPSQAFDAATIERLMAVMAKSDLCELRVTQGGASVFLARASRADNAASVSSGDAASMQPAPGSSPPPAVAGDSAAAVRAPLYGIVYLTPAPDQEPFVRVGSAVRPGQTLLLLEAMKSFHEVSAERAGVVTAIRVEAGQEVQAGAVLMEIGEHV